MSELWARGGHQNFRKAAPQPRTGVWEGIGRLDGYSRGNRVGGVQRSCPGGDRAQAWPEGPGAAPSPLPHRHHCHWPEPWVCSSLQERQGDKSACREPRCCLRRRAERPVPPGGSLQPPSLLLAGTGLLPVSGHSGHFL